MPEGLQSLAPQVSVTTWCYNITRPNPYHSYIGWTWWFKGRQKVFYWYVVWLARWRKNCAHARMLSHKHMCAHTHLRNCTDKIQRFDILYASCQNSPSQVTFTCGPPQCLYKLFWIIVTFLRSSRGFLYAISRGFFCFSMIAPVISLAL